jgi:GT2 family glycosyltransferase
MTASEIEHTCSYTTEDGVETPVSVTPSIRAVLVLYKVHLADSLTFQSLSAVLQQDAAAAQAIHLTVFDNTPGPPRSAGNSAVEYHHDPSNPGLARSYNLALATAGELSDEWLMLLDQDTTLTSAYFSEALSLTQRFARDGRVVAIVPKLVENGRVHSPHGDLVKSEPEALPRDFHGVSERAIHAFNSGAIVRASALRAVGGFPEKFWLDFLDHATFHLLQAQGGSIYVMSAELQHQLSTNGAIKGWNRTYLARHANLLRAEYEFYRSYGNAQQKQRYRLRLMRHAYGSLKHFRLPMVWQLLRTMTRTK